MGESSGKPSAQMIDHLLEDPSALQTRILNLLQQRLSECALHPAPSPCGAVASSVMFLLGRLTIEGSSATPETCIILNKRSKIVRQSGDLCCPGGTVEARIDPYLARLLSFPCSPLARWPLWSSFRCRQPFAARTLSLLFATALRESWEEMRLNPFGVTFLGPLPPERLMLFKRIIYPMAGWIRKQDQFVPSWEVEKIVTIPVRTLLDPVRYANYRIYVPPAIEKKLNHRVQDMPCFIHKHKGHTEILWGATYRMVACFVQLVFGFTPPELSTLPMIPGIMDENYIHRPS
jgi:8-oxo-dGTP pyrophosphatase MutT (NUDIX family)